MPLAAGDRLGPYEIVAPLGAGGMGEVYRARDPRLGREVAIKVLPAEVADDPSRLQRFEQEARAIAALNHPNILAIHDFGQAPGAGGRAVHYIVTELLDGETLRERLTHGALPVRKTIDYGVQMARGLAAAHDKGLIHRDLKPENLFLLRDGQVKILDFGLATASRGAIAGDRRTVTALTDPGLVLGTIGYMAPEQVRGQSVDARADLFAFGAVLYEMLSGQRAFSRETAADTMTAILKEDPPDLTGTRAELSPALDRIVRHCLEKNPVERFQSARDVAFALEALSGRQSSNAAAAFSGAAWRRWTWPAGIAAAIIAAAGLGMLVQRWLTPPQAALTFEKKTWDPMSIFNARFGPDGQTIIFSAATAGNIPELYAVRPGTIAPEPLGDKNVQLLSVSPKGELAVIMNARYDHHRIFDGTLARMTLDSPPRPWMEDVRDADWAPDGEQLAIVHKLPGGDQLEYPAGTARYKAPGYGYLSDLRVSPDGSQVAFFEHEAEGDDRGWVKLLTRNGDVRLLAGEYWGEEGLAWSLDGQTVFFSASKEGASEQVLSVNVSGAPVVRQRIPSAGGMLVEDVARDGRLLLIGDDFRYGLRALVPGEMQERDLHWLDFSLGANLSFDRRTLVFSDLSESAGSNYAVDSRDMTTGKVLRLGEGYSWGLSPDGRWAGAGIAATGELRAYPTGAGQPLRISAEPVQQFTGDSLDGPEWFQDSRHVLICGRPKGLPPRCYAEDIQGGPAEAITPPGVTAAWLAPDDKTLLGQTGPDSYELLSRGTSTATPVKGFTVADHVIGWDTDQQTVAVSVGNAVPARVERVDLASGKRTLVREIAPSDSAGVTSVRVTQWIDDGRGYVYDFLRRDDALFIVK